MNQKDLYTFTVKDAKGESLCLDKFRGQAVLIVNVASKCGFTPQYKELENLFQQFQNRGFTILGFPCNQFGGQEPGTNEEIQSFCKLTYGISFPVLAKVDVNGTKAEPLYDWLKTSAPGLLGTEMIKWNFTKFLVGKDGMPVKRYAPNCAPNEIAKDLEKIL